MIIRIILYILAAVVMAAHFLRTGNLLLVSLCLLAPLLFFYRQRWSLLLLQLLAYCGAIVWLWTAYSLIELYKLRGMPWTRTAIILGGVALFTLLVGLLLNSRSMRDRYHS